MEHPRITKLTFEVDANGRQKLGGFLSENLSELSKMYLRSLIRDGKVEVNGRLENAGYRVRSGDFIEVEADMSRGTSMVAEDISLDVMFEDDELIVVNKPAGMLVHPSHREKTGTLLNALTNHLNAECGVRSAESTTGHAGFRISASGFIRPGLIHRLDKDTSGLIVVAKTPRAHRIIAGHFMKKRVEKQYLALVDGVVEREEGSIEAPIGRHTELKHWSVKADGKHSQSRYRVRERYADTTLLELEPVTGRTNQLRIHCELIGHPIVGDIKRGGSGSARLCLHAYKLGFPHPTTNEVLRFTCLAPFGTRSVSEA